MTSVDKNVVVVVVTYNSRDVILQLLDSLPAAVGSIDAEIVVVDNGSADGTAEVIDGRTDCTLLRSTNTGYAAGVNKGIAAAHGTGPVLVLNPDTLLTLGSVEILLRALSRPRVGVVAPRILNPDGTTFRSLRREPTLLRAAGFGFTGWSAVAEYVDLDAAYELPHSVDWALGAALLLSRACLDDVGGWDETFFLYSEETDFCLRASDKGWLTWFDPAAEVVHIGGQSGQNSATHVMQIINRIRLYRRRHGLIKSAAYFGLTLLSEVSWAVRGHHQSVAAIRAMLRPGLRPPELQASDSLLPS